MKNLKQKLSRQEGFTLIEMLIVVAIIAILIAISIPVVNSALEKAKHATDAANERAAKAAIVIKSLEDSFDASEVYYYDAANGDLKTVGTGITGYGQHKGHAKTSSNEYIIAVKMNATTSVVEMQWIAKTSAEDSVTGITVAGTGNNALCSESKQDHN